MDCSLKIKSLTCNYFIHKILYYLILAGTNMQTALLLSPVFSSHLTVTVTCKENNE